MIALLIALNLIVLHRSDGLEVVVNAQQITSLRALEGEAGVFHHPSTRCLVGLTDGKFVAVRETCKAIEHVLQPLEERHP